MGEFCVPFSEEPEPEHADVAHLCDEGVCKLPADGEAGVSRLCVAQVSAEIGRMRPKFLIGNGLRGTNLASRWARSAAFARIAGFDVTTVKKRGAIKV